MKKAACKTVRLSGGKVVWQVGEGGLLTKKVLSGNTVDLNLYVYKNDGSLMAAPDELRSIKDGLGAAKGWIRNSERMDQEQLRETFPQYAVGCLADRI